jgi:hypothetical protein
MSTLAAESPCYCPSCQRIFRLAPYGYVCPEDQTPVIDVGAPLPKSFARTIFPVGVTFTVLIALAVSSQLV